MTQLRLALAITLSLATSMIMAQTLDIHAPGSLKNNDGVGLANRIDYAPGMGVAFAEHPTILRSQVNESGGGAVGGDQCSRGNYLDNDGGPYDWWDTYCERRGRERTSLCSRKRVHQGLDIVGGTQQTCRQNVADGRQGLSSVDNVPVIAVADGEIGAIGQYTVRLNTKHGLFRYMHLNMSRLAVTEGQVVRQGDFIGYMSRDFGGNATTYHLHLELWKNLGQGNTPVPLYFTYALAQARHTGQAIRIVDTGEVIKIEETTAPLINLTPMISSFWTFEGDKFGLIASGDERLLLNLEAHDLAFDGQHVSLVDARKRDYDIHQHYVGDLQYKTSACGPIHVPVAGPISDDSLIVRLATHVPNSESCEVDSWSLHELRFDFERANPDFVAASVDMNYVRSQQAGRPGVITSDQPEIVRVSKSEITRNWSAITPQSAYPAWPEYLLNWPGLDRSAPIFDSAGNEIPTLKTDSAGVGLWWYWLHKRAGGSGVLNPSSVSFAELSKGMAGVDETTHPAAARYLNQYITLSETISGQPVTETTSFDLSDGEARWIVAQTMFFHESGRPVELPRSIFETGVKLGQDILDGTFTSLNDYR